MKTILLYQPASRRGIYLAFGCAVALHCAAVAFAARHPSPPAAVAGDGPPEVTIELPPADEDPTLPLPSVDEAPSPAPPAPVKTPLFVEPSLPVKQAPPQRVARPPTPPNNTSRASNTITRGGGKAFAIMSPRPEYPYEARRLHLTGTGVALLTIDRSSGSVTGVTMSRSTGSTVLDQSALAALRHWRFRPGTVARVECPITYTLTGASL
ncbi:MAG: TonB family protein [Chthoniobacterales bacterium]